MNTAIQEDISKLSIEEIQQKCMDPWWRICNLYYIINKAGLKVRFCPNHVQVELYFSTHNRNIIPKARQHGVTTMVAIIAVDFIMFTKNVRVGIIAHTRDDATVIFRDKIKFAYDNLPDVLRALNPATKNDAGELLLSNNSGVRVGTSFRSSTAQLVHVTEFGFICARYPKKAREILTGSLPAVPMDGQIWLEGTAEGREGAFYTMTDEAKHLAASKVKLSELQYKLMFFAWWRNPEYVMDPAKVRIPERLAEYFFALLDRHKIKLNKEQMAWYTANENTLGDDMKSQYPSTIEEAFEVTIEGAYYKKQMDKVYGEERIRDLPWIPSIKVDTYWDIGYDDSTAIWFVQKVGRWRHHIDYYENSGEGLEHYKDVLVKKGYKYGVFIGPHDLKDHEWTSGTTIRETAATEYGIKFDLAPDVSVQDGIEAVRRMLPHCVFDAAKCEPGIKALCAYRKEWDADDGVWKSQPNHDWTSHCADAARYEALSCGIRSHGPGSGSKVERGVVRG